MNFSFHGLALHITSGQEQYNEIRKPFYQYAADAVEEFQQLYCKNQSIEAVVEDAPDQFLQSMQPVIGHCVDFLIQHHIYAVDTDTFWEKYEEIIDQWSKSYYIIADQVAELRLSQQQLSEYRTMRRQLRGRVIGGGFGISGAIKGMAAAGAMNAVIGMGHMLFNGIGGIATSISTAAALRKIFEDPDTLQNLKVGVYHSAFGCHFALVDCYNQYSNANIPVPNADDVQLSRNYYNNASRLTDPIEKTKLLLSALELNPYDEGSYRALLNLFGDEKQELEQIATYFGVNIGKIKSEYIDDCMSDSSFKNADAKSQKAILEQLMQNTQISGKASQAFQEKLYHLDREARTVSGVTFDTIEEADESRIEKDALDAIIKNVHWDDRFSLRESLPLIDNYHSPLAHFLHARILQQLAKIESELCNVEMGWGEPPIEFSSLEESQKGLIAINTINQRLKQSNLLDEGILLEICTWLEHMNFPIIVQKRYYKLIQGWIETLHQQKNDNNDNSYSRYSDQNNAQSQTAHSAKRKSSKHGCLKRVIAAAILLVALLWVGGQILEKATANEYITRAEFAQLINELTPLNSNFSLDYSGVVDVSQLHWAKNAISACIENGIMLCEIYPDTGQAFFNPDEVLSKEAFAYALSKVCTIDSEEFYSSTSLYNTDFPTIAYSDKDKANKAYVDAIDCMQHYKLIGTDEEGYYQPQKKITWTYVRDVLNRCTERGYLALSKPVDELLENAHAPENYHSISVCSGSWLIYLNPYSILQELK